MFSLIQILVYADIQANREDLEAANLVLSWWNTAETPTTKTRDQPPLHTDPVLPNPNSSIDPSLSKPSTTTEKGMPASIPATLGSVDEWDVTTPPVARSGAPSAAGSSGSGEARKITLKVNRS